MKIGFNKLPGVILVLPAGFGCCVTAALVRTDNSVPFGLAGGFWILLLAGLFSLTRSYVEVWKGTVIVKPVIGFGAKRYGYHSVRDFSIEGREVFLDTGGLRRKLNVLPWLVDRRGWSSFLQWIETGRRESK